MSNNLDVIFKSYDIRGVFGDTLSLQDAYKIGLVDAIGGIGIAKRQLAQRIGAKRVKTIEFTPKRK